MGVPPFVVSRPSQMTDTDLIETSKLVTVTIVQQEYGIFSLDLVIRYKVFFLMDSCTIGIVFQESD